jgi:hypothetical protein
LTPNSAITYRCIALLHLLYRWQHQSQKLRILPRINIPMSQTYGYCLLRSFQEPSTGPCSGTDYCRAYHLILFL